MKFMDALGRDGEEMVIAYFKVQFSVQLERALRKLVFDFE
jgi:hypothetical protein